MTPSLNIHTNAKLIVDLSGAIITPSALTSHVASGIICRKLKLTSIGCSVFILMCQIVLVAMTSILMFLGCPNLDIAGVNMPYTGRLDSLGGQRYMLIA